MLSMTGYGSGSAGDKEFSIKTELQTYNHRFLDIKVRLPGEYQSLESYINKKISGRLSRGRVNVYVGFKQGGDRYRVVINESLARKYWNALNRLQRAVKARTSVGPEVLIKLPGVLETALVIPSVREFRKQVGLSLARSLEELLSMRAKEGARMAADLAKHIRTFSGYLARVRARLKKKEREQLKGEKSKPSGNSRGQIPTGINVQEELSRLESHIVHFKEFLASDKPAGKTLEFICQEMLREVTTLGDKASDSLISRQIVLMKSELESLREQARNVE